MKYAKMFGLVALAAMALMAVVAASASANAKVCSTAGTGGACLSGHGKVYTGVIKASSTNAVLTGALTVSCKESSAEGEITNGETGTGKITALTFNNCSAGILGSCTAKTTASGATPWAATATTDTPGVINTNGWLDAANVTGQFTCAGVTCKYEKAAVNNEVTIDGSDTANAKLTADVTLPPEAGNPGLCGSGNATWTATYTVSSPSTIMIE